MQHRLTSRAISTNKQHILNTKLFRQFATLTNSTTQSTKKLKWSEMTASDRFVTALGATTTLGMLGMSLSPEFKASRNQISSQQPTTNTNHSNQLDSLLNSASNLTPSSLPSLFQISPEISQTLQSAPLLSTQTPLASTSQQAARHSLSRPVTIDGQRWPTYNQYMISQGAINGTNEFDYTSTYGLMGTFWLITSAYLASAQLPAKSANRVLNWYIDNMSLSFDNRKKPWTYLTSAMTHYGVFHVGANSLAFHSFAPSVGVSSSNALLALFLTLAVSSSVIGLGLNLSAARIMLKLGKTRPTLMLPIVGASGAVVSMFTIAALTHPTQGVSLLGITPSIGILTGLAGMMTFDAVGFAAHVAGYRTPISHAGHLGGYIAGLILFMTSKDKFEKKYQRDTFNFYGNWLELTWAPESAKNYVKRSEPRNH